MILTRDVHTSTSKQAERHISLKSTPLRRALILLELFWEKFAQPCSTSSGAAERQDAGGFSRVKAQLGNLAYFISQSTSILVRHLILMRHAERNSPGLADDPEHSHVPQIIRHVE